MTTPQKYDAIIIGASAAAYGRLSPALAKSGWKVALIERDQVGGSCINVGCIPTKAMIASARVAYMARRAGEYGVRTSEVSVDMAQVHQHKQDLVTAIRGFAVRRLCRHIVNSCRGRKAGHRS